MTEMALFSVINWPCFELTKTVVPKVKVDGSHNLMLRANPSCKGNDALAIRTGSLSQGRRYHATTTVRSCHAQMGRGATAAQHTGPGCVPWHWPMSRSTWTRKPDISAPSLEYNAAPRTIWPACTGLSPNKEHREIKKATPPCELSLLCIRSTVWA